MSSSPDRILLATLRGTRHWPPPVWYMRQAGRYLPEYREVREKSGGFMAMCLDPDLATTVTLQPITRYGLDGAILFSDILMVPYGLGVGVRVEEGIGPVLDPVTPPAVPVYDRDSFARRTAPVHQAVTRIRKVLPPATTLLGFAGAPWTVATYMVEGGSSRDFLATKQWMYDDPAGFGRLVDVLVEATADYLDAQITAGAEAVQIFDSWAGVLPPEMFDAWVIAPTARLVARLRERHETVPVIGFPRGAGIGYLDYGARTGVDFLSLDTTLPLDWALSALPPRLGLQGNLDPALVVTGGVAMEQAATAILDRMAKSERPFVFNLGHGLVPPTPPAHVAALTACIRGTGEVQDNTPQGTAAS